MRKIFISALALIWVHGAAAKEPADMQDLMAGMGIATMCRDKFNDQQLFEAAAEKFITQSATATDKPDGFDAVDVVEGFRSAKPDLSEVNANKISTDLLKSLCGNMRQSLLN